MRQIKFWGGRLLSLQWELWLLSPLWKRPSEIITGSSILPIAPFDKTRGGPPGPELNQVEPVSLSQENGIGTRDYSCDCSPALNRAEERVVRVAGKVGLQREATWVPVIISAPVLALQEVWLPPRSGPHGSPTSPYNKPTSPLFCLSQLQWIYVTCDQRGLTCIQTTAQKKHTKPNMYSAPHARTHTHTHRHTNIRCLNSLFVTPCGPKGSFFRICFLESIWRNLSFQFNWEQQWSPTVVP